ncbi:hypothetical protein [Nostoc sp.]|uniref:hypothetical protein n=1 Tax=Nostoc sp. TaxID=1180 RepID=UPI002FF58D71
MSFAGTDRTRTQYPYNTELPSDFSSLEIYIYLNSVAIALSMVEIYRGVVFE